MATENVRATELTRPTTLNPMAWVRWLYDWVLLWGKTRYGIPALVLLAFAESSFFPVPPDVLLIALCLGLPKRAFYFAGVCALASVAGGMAGYLIGWVVWEQVQEFFFHYVFSQELFGKVSDLYHQYDFWAVFVAGFTPIPYKVFTIAAGVFELDFPRFVLASFVSRSARFFLVAALIWKFGSPVTVFIDKYFNLLTFVFMALLIGGFLIVKLVM